VTIRRTSPIPWLGALLAIYLIAPLVAFAIRLRHVAPGVPGLGGALLTSVITASISTAIIALLGIPLAYRLARARGPLGAALSVVVALPLALPPLMSGILLLYLVGPYTALGRLFSGQLTDTRAGIVIAQTFVAAPFLIVAARGAFAAVDPALEDVARTLGHGAWGRFRKVALPAAWGGIQAGLLLAWLRAFGEFGATVILAYHPYSLPVFTFVQFDSTGVPATVVPVATALGAALVILLATQAHAARRRRPPMVPSPAGPPPSAGPPLRFSLRKQLGDFALSLQHEARSPRLALLGPSGAGKSLTLRLLAGITRADHAEIRSAALRLSDLAAEHRHVGYLPQRSALLPRRTVWQQVNLAVDTDPSLAAWWLIQLGLAGLEDRLPDELSGGQQRRVALARALARAPALILLDEPFSGLDAPVRERLYRQLRQLQRDAALSTVVVTHDPREAALLADEVIVLSQGEVLQQGPIAEVFAHPRSAEVATLVGLPNANSGRVERPGSILAGQLELEAPTAELPAGTDVLWAVPPQAVALDPSGPHPATVIDCLDLGSRVEARLALGELELTAWTAPGSLTPGGAVRVRLPAECLRVWPATQPVQPGPEAPG
jgi:ABC-type sulfate/molybdate transport systems ATPase subunit/ABC-type sulfate transport system permease component